MKIVLSNVERGGWRTAYSATIVVDGKPKGYVQRVQGDSQYRAFAGGRLVARAPNLADVRLELKEHFETYGVGEEDED